MDAFKSTITNLSFNPLTSTAIEVCNIDPKIIKKTFTVQDGCVKMNYSDLLTFLNTIHIPYDALQSTSAGADFATLAIEYSTGRKDFVLGRLLEDQHITPKDYTNSVVAGIDFHFQPYRENIKYPYFVFYLREYLEAQYGKGFLDQ